jgi:DNA-binding CsgD family transcriptional regulator
MDAIMEWALMTNDPEKRVSESTAGVPHGRSSAGDEARRNQYAPRAPEHPADAGAEARPLFGRAAALALVVWGVMVLGVTGGIAGATALWPLVPVLGVVLPLGLAFVAAWHAKNQMEVLRGREVRADSTSDERAERELLGALLQNEGLTPASAAARTSLGVSQAAEVLEGLAAKGHLDVAAVDGDLVYSLRDGGPRAPALSEPEENSKALAAANPEPDAAVDLPVEPLSERELEVMRLLASGRTNREIAHELYVSHGTVKAHTANIYRKLGAHNRAEMISRARTLGLLG